MRRSSFPLLLSVLFALRLGGASPGPEELGAASLVRQLGAGFFQARERAARELLKRAAVAR